ncbi:MAG: cobalamin biosynthesis protein CbiG [Ilumatobacteraceae bacterium]
MPLFDRYVAVDWSASGRPTRGPNSIWTCVMAGRDGSTDLENHPTREAATRHLAGVLAAAADRVLVAFDFAFGFPNGFARAAHLAGEPPWVAAWRHLDGALVDRPDNANNRFEVAERLNARIGEGPGPFWGTARGARVSAHLSPRRAPGFPHGGLVEHRLAERAFQRAGRWPCSVWQLTGAGSVGSQTLTGIPAVHRLRRRPDLVGRSLVWPFETGLVDDPTQGRPDVIVHAEVWPSAVPLDENLHPVRDAAQVIGLCRHLRELDSRGELGALFAPDLDAASALAVLDEEGWILGAPHTHRAGRSPV